MAYYTKQECLPHVPFFPLLRGKHIRSFCCFFCHWLPHLQMQCYIANLDFLVKKDLLTSTMVVTPTLPVHTCTFHSPTTVISLFCMLYIQCLHYYNINAIYRWAMCYIKWLFFFPWKETLIPTLTWPSMIVFFSFLKCIWHELFKNSPLLFKSSFN